MSDDRQTTPQIPRSQVAIRSDEAIVVSRNWTDVEVKPRSKLGEQDYRTRLAKGLAVPASAIRDRHIQALAYHDTVVNSPDFFPLMRETTLRNFLGMLPYERDGELLTALAQANPEVDGFRTLEAQNRSGELRVSASRALFELPEFRSYEGLERLDVCCRRLAMANPDLILTYNLALAGAKDSMFTIPGQSERWIHRDEPLRTEMDVLGNFDAAAQHIMSYAERIMDNMKKGADLVDLIEAQNNTRSLRQPALSDEAAQRIFDYADASIAYDPYAVRLMNMARGVANLRGYIVGGSDVNAYRNKFQIKEEKNKKTSIAGFASSDDVGPYFYTYSRGVEWLLDTPRLKPGDFSVLAVKNTVLEEMLHVAFGELYQNDRCTFPAASPHRPCPENPKQDAREILFDEALTLDLARIDLTRETAVMSLRNDLTLPEDIYSEETFTKELLVKIIKIWERKSEGISLPDTIRTRYPHLTHFIEHIVEKDITAYEEARARGDSWDPKTMLSSVDLQTYREERNGDIAGPWTGRKGIAPQPASDAGHGGIKR